MNYLREMYRLAQQRARDLKPVKDKNYPIRPFKVVLQDMAIIAEIKYATPAEGNLGVREKPGRLAKMFEDFGAKAISCLTEPRYFSGDLAFIPKIKLKCTLPVLMKDFIVDERQILSGRARGADAFLLIAEMLSLEELRRLYRFGQDLGMDVLVEAYGRKGLEQALEIGAEIMGVNSRNLATLAVKPERHAEMIRLLPSGVVKVAESGIRSGARLKELKDMGYDAVLIGRALTDEVYRKDIFACG
jgi:indole-3-glycerol phosphate synthase